MLLAMSYHQANERVIAGGAATATATATVGVEFHAGSSMLAHVGRLMTRAVPFIIVMVNQ